MTELGIQSLVTTSAVLLLQVLDTLAEINERHEAVKELEKSLMELHQVFLDMAVLVEAQGEMLDNIEQQVRLSAAAPIASLHVVFPYQAHELLHFPPSCLHPVCMFMDIVLTFWCK